MTAREMFEALGYEYYEGEHSIRYIANCDMDDDYISIKFGLLSHTFYAHHNCNPNDITIDEFEAIQQQMKELGWIEEKPETNFEHYFEYLSKLNMSDFALIDGRVVQCLGTHCRGCDFNGDCIERKFKWLKQPYEKTTFKLTQFEYDLLNAYKNSGMRQCISNYGTLLEMYGKGHFKGIDTSTPIREILDNCKVV